MSKRNARNVKERLINWFNDSRFIGSLLTIYSGAQRLRICENCGVIKKNIHWAMKNEYTEKTEVYSHVWLCDVCFYGPIFFVDKKSRMTFIPELTTESWLTPKDERRK